MAPDVDVFRALARSSPALWRSVRFTFDPESGDADGRRHRAWVTRPDRLRVETMDGILVTAEGGDVRLGPGSTVARSTRSVSVLRDDAEAAPTNSRFSLPAGEDTPGFSMPASYPEGEFPDLAALPPDPRATPTLRADGLVGAWEGRGFGDDTVPFFGNYRWVAMLEPFELADGADPDIWSAPDVRPAPLEYESIGEVDHHGRPALEAVVRTTGRYDPRCGCCPLLDGAEALAVEEAAYGAPLFVDSPTRPDATRFVVRLDRGTGICVHARALDGTHPECRVDVAIEEVDVPYPDEFFRIGATGLTGSAMDFA